MTEAGIPDGQADAIIKVMQGGVATKHDLELTETRVQTRFATLDAKIDQLDNKVNLILVTIVLGVVAPPSSDLPSGEGSVRPPLVALSGVAPHERVVPIGRSIGRSCASRTMPLPLAEFHTASPNECGVGLHGVAMVQSVCATDKTM